MTDIDNELDLLIRAIMLSSKMPDSDFDYIIDTSIVKIKALFEPEAKALLEPKIKAKLHCRDCKHGVLWIDDYPCSQCKGYSNFTKKVT